LPRPAAPAVAGVDRSAKQILLDYVTRLMYEEISYIIVFESRCGLPRRALFLVRCDEVIVMVRSSTRRFCGQMKAGARCLRTREILPVQFTRENFPVNFLLFTGEGRFALPSVVLASERGYVPQSVPLNAADGQRLAAPSTAACVSSVAQPFLTFCANKANGCTNKANGQNHSKNNV
jgi:hypothetical protein